MRLFVFLLFGVSLVTQIFAFTSSMKQVKNLPGLGYPINFRHYSGYLQASETRFLHAWFVESQNEPADDPVLLWMNGGPGCSSLDGFLSELGPFHIKDDGVTVYDNIYSWNKVANVLFLEAPAGVGFSFATDNNVTTDDNQVSMDNYNALKQFFTLMPQFKSNPFFISGESYGGIYVPTLSVRVIEGLDTFPINFKGVAIGNGMLSFTLNTDTLVLFAYYHGLVSEEEYLSNERACCSGCGDTCDYTHSAGTCEQFVTKVQSLLDTVNMYDLYGNCYVPSRISSNNRYFHDAKLTLGAKTRDFFARREHKLNRFLEFAAGEHVPCINDTAITNYLNQKSVRRSLYIPTSVQQWAICSGDVGGNYKILYNDMFSQIRTILNHNIPILVYNGDTDLACNFLMGQKFSQMLGLKELQAKKFWQFENQVGGTVTQYEGLQFVTVRGAGHMVPQWRPGPALAMISKFLAGEPL